MNLESTFDFNSVDISNISTDLEDSEGVSVDLHSDWASTEAINNIKVDGVQLMSVEGETSISLLMTPMTVGEVVSDNSMLVEADVEVKRDLIVVLQVDDGVLIDFSDNADQTVVGEVDGEGGWELLKIWGL